ncbi:hypothetical protein [Methyloradius palustris]|uniref:Uncharacterized protein n=1 Tax=Methyloradius palustris TaxID=2778876 RepID=A0A8D5G0L1_9PROT|nr:hypothetical protein [Methyloradius palustris]BCM25160.1 hypothetical protein ZMTM_14190 [Methyloradius palustris]
MRITIKTSIKDFYTDLKNQNIEGLTVKAVTKDSLADIPTPYVTFIVIVAAGVTLELFKVWLNKKLKTEVKEHTVINGNQVNIENLNITVIDNYLVGDHHDEDGQSKTD